MPKSTTLLTLLLLSISLTLNAAVPQTALLPYQLTYKASYNGMPITAVRELSVDESGVYTLKSKASNWLGRIEETGVFTLDEHNDIVNQSYEYRRSVFGIKKTERLTYDHTQGKAFYQEGKKEKTVPLDQPFHSRFSYQLQLRRDLIDGKREFVYPTLARGKTKIYRFTIAGEEKLETSLGKINTVKVIRVREGSERETALWFAKDWSYLLVKLWQREEDGEDYQITLKAGSLSGVPLSKMQAGPARDQNSEN